MFPTLLDAKQPVQAVQPMRMMAMGLSALDEEPQGTPEAQEPLPMVMCSCGRTVSADVMVDISVLPPEQNPEGLDYVCDGCLSAFIRCGVFSSADLAIAHGMPEEFIDQMRYVDSFTTVNAQYRPIRRYPTSF